MKTKLASSVLVMAALAPPSVAFAPQQQGQAKSTVQEPAQKKESSDALRKRIEERVKEIIVEQLGVDKSKVVPEARFIDDLGTDSLDIVELTMAIEEEFKIEISDAEAEKFLRVRDVYDYVANRMSQSSEKPK